METPSFFSSSWPNPPPVGLLTGLSPRQVAGSATNKLILFLQNHATVANAD